jgi:hypothetical protein
MHLVTELNANSEFILKIIEKKAMPTAVIVRQFITAAAQLFVQ